MTINVLDTLAALVKQERHALLSRWRQQVRQLPSARQLDIPTLNDHIPGLLDELAAALQSKSDQTIPEALSEGSPPLMVCSVSKRPLILKRSLRSTTSFGAASTILPTTTA